MILNALSVATFLLAVFTLVPLIRHEAWWVRVFDFPRLQLLVVSSLLLVLESVLLNLSQPLTWGLLAVGVLSFLYHAYWILPYTRVFPVEVEAADSLAGHPTIKIITANVLTPNRNASGLIGLVQKHAPDILVTLESDTWWQERLDVLAADLPYTIKCPLDNLYGMHVYSRFPFAEGRIEYLVEPDVPSIHGLVKMPDGHNIRIHFLHPAPPSPTENEQSSERDAELLIVAQSVAEADTPVIVTGDLNDVAWSETTRLFRKISGLLDPRVGRGMFNTFHANWWFFRWPLDHLFHSRHFTLCRIHRLPKFGSDHFALLTELAYQPGYNPQQAGLVADHEDLEWAQVKAKNEGVCKEDVPTLDKT